jgi:uncharacterized protein YegP (UPF0339 family)
VAANFEIRSPKAGRYVWVLVSQGRTLATSPEYGRRALAEKAIAAFRLAATAAPVVDTTAPAAKPATSKAARAVGRVLGKAVVIGGRAVETAEQAAANTAKRAAKTVQSATPPKPATQRAAPRAGGRKG